PVVVVGNLVAGGAGKTPLLAALAEALSAGGWRVGIIASGYGAARRDARLVGADDDPAEHGDEAVLLAQTTGLPLAAARRRAEALALLIARHPGLQVVLSDDGLQHASLPRSVELAVFDARGAGNGRLLPAGPLREPLEHARRMDALLLNGEAAAPLPHARCFRFRVEPVRFVPVAAARGAGAGAGSGADADAVRSSADAVPLHPGAAPIAPQDFAHFAGKRNVLAVAGTGAPQRFFDTLRALGLAPRCLALPDHAPLDAATLAAQPEPIIVMTTKDAVKCRGWADDRCWALEVRAVVDPAFIDWLIGALRGHTPA
ncbi:MAG: tetraacyldisaccharide 4'-kinase, partial [Burkholderiales bacterium]|nr:tetraacyldisaccharide 4'-kinase [Burkholderiales bacterium]